MLSFPGKEDIIALDEQIETKAKALSEKLNGSTDLSEVGEVNATLNELLQSRELTKAILDNLNGSDV